MPVLFGNTFAALAYPHFRILWIGTLFAFTGFFMSTVAQSVVAFDLTGTNSAVGQVVFAQGLMMFLLGPIGGAYSDRLPKRRVIAICQTMTMMVFFSIALAIRADAISLAGLLLGSLVMGASFSFLGPARQSLSIELIPTSARGNAVALTQVANSACRVTGPALAGVLLALGDYGVSLSYFVMGLFYLVSIVSLSFLPKSRVRQDAREKRVFEDVLDGLRYVGRSQSLRSLMLMFTLVIIVGFPHVTLLPGFVENQLNLPAESSSLLFGSTALGALVAGVAVARFADSPRAPALLVASAFGYGVSLILSALSPTLSIATAALFVVGLLSGGFQTLAGAVIIKQVAPNYVGRVMSLTMLSFGGFGLMGLPVGYVADLVGENTTFALLGVGVCIVVATLQRAVRHSRLEPQPTAPA